MVNQERKADQQWDHIYGEKFMTMWYPNEDIVRFCSRLIKKRVTYDTYDVRKNVQSVLDLGCGNGRHIIFFGRKGFKVSGIDISTKAIEWAKDWCRWEGVEADLRVGNVTQLPYADHSFDVVVSHGVLDHLLMEEARSAAEEVGRVLKPCGLFYFDLRSIDDFESGIGKQIAKNTFVIAEGLEEGLIQHFFTLDEVHRLIDGLFRVIYMETNDRRLGPDFDRKYSRWVLAAERLGVG